MKSAIIFEFVFANLIENRQTSLFSGIWREIRKQIHQKFAENAKFDGENEKNRKFNFSIAKTFSDF
jgi:hypothetical protein